MADDFDFVCVGVIVKSHGLNGELKVKPLTDYPSRFQELSRVFLIPPGGGTSALARIKGTRMQGDHIVLKLEEIDARNQAQEYVGFEIAIPGDECLPLPPDSYYGFDLIGMEVVLSDGEVVGMVKDTQSMPAQDLLVVKDNKGLEVMVPLVSAIVTDISFEAGKIEVNNMPGLFDPEY